jgi:tetratricopeptide (TPR) repeat protein
MILRVSEPLSRTLVVLATIVIAAPLSYYSVRMASAAHAAELGTADGLKKAIELEPYNPDYWYRRGHFQQFNLEEPDSELAGYYFRKAIALYPNYTDAWLDLGTNNELERHTEAAREAFLQAEHSYPSSAEVAWRYGNFLLRNDDRPQAYVKLRRAIEADPRRAAAAFSLAYRANPDIDEILGQLLPPKQSVYVDVIGLAARTNQLAVGKAVWERLLRLRPRLAIGDFTGLASGLLVAGESSEARRVWDQGVATMNLPPLLEPQGSVVWDPSFETGMYNSTFSWRYLSKTQSVNIGLDKAEKHSGSQSFRLTFDGKHNENLEPACTMVSVEPNTVYRFSGWVRTRDLTTNSGIGFRIHSVGAAPSVNQTPELHDTNPWTLLDMRWTAGPHVHQASICIMREPSDTPNMNISGSAWVDDVNLVPQSAEPRQR